MVRLPYRSFMTSSKLFYFAAITVGLLHSIALNAESISYTEVKPTDNWIEKKYDATGWKNVTGWSELAEQIKGEAWIRFEASYPIKSLNNLVIDGRLRGELAISVNGRKAYSIQSHEAKENQWPLTKQGMGSYARPDERTVFGLHYQPEKADAPQCAVSLKALPMDYLEENTATGKRVVLEGDDYMRDTQVEVGRDGRYYMTGTSGNRDFMFGEEQGSDGKKHQWLFNRGIQVYVSADLRQWKSLGYVWQFDRDGTWSKEIGKRDGADARAVYAPEIHYLKKRDRYYIVYGPNTRRQDGSAYGLGILSAENPQGPYQEVTGTRPICGGFDGNLFEDDDGTVYLLRNGGMIMRLKNDLSGPVEPERLLRPANFPRVGFEGVYLFKRNGIYYLTAAEIISYRDGYSSYSTVVATATSIYGPYSDRYVAYPCAGHSSVFQATDGQWYATSFTLPGKGMYPGVFPVGFDVDNRLILPKAVGVPFHQEMARLTEESYR
jgi:xylan 1,4-beta-xylosidase